MSIKFVKNNRLGKKKSLGQGMTEYIIIVGVIAVAAIGVFGAFGNVIENQVTAMSAELSGGDGAADTGLAVGEAQKARDQAAKRNNLSNFSDNGK